MLTVFFIKRCSSLEALRDFPCVVLLLSSTGGDPHASSLWQVLPPFTTRKTVRHLEWKRTLWSLCGRDRWKGKPAWLIRAGETYLSTPLPPPAAFTCSAVPFTAHSTFTLPVCV